MKSRKSYISGLLAVYVCFSASVALAQGPTDAAKDKARAFNLEAIKLQSEGKPNDAIILYKRAIELYPQGGAYHNNLAVVLKDLNRWEEAEAEARIALRLKPDRADYHFNLGIILNGLKKYDEAEKQFMAAVEKDASDVESRYRLAEILQRNSKLPEAELQVKMALLLKPNEARYHQLLGDIDMQLEKREDALSEYKKVIEYTTDGNVSGAVLSRIEFLKQALNSR
jgi:tetratricopeptide (TPR) repeat protein